VKKKKTRRPVAISSVLERVMKDLGIGARVKIVRIITRWDKIFSPPVSRVSLPRDLKGKTLFIEVQDSVWLQQLTFMDQLIMDRINQEFGPGTVRKVCFSVGPVPERQGAEEEGPGPNLDAIVLANEDLDAIRECVKGIPDLELRRDLRRIMGKDWKLKKFRRERSPACKK